MSSQQLAKNVPVLGSDLNQCQMCRHLTRMGSRAFDGWKCKAFGEADIPKEILEGAWDHREPWHASPSDGGTTFEDIPGARYTYEDLAGPVNNDD